MAESDSALKIIPRKEAKVLGLRHYFTGKPCKRGHVSKRLLSTNQCCECLYVCLKLWRKDNPEERLKRDRAWKSKNRDRINASYRKRYSDNPTFFVDKTKRYYRNNSEKVKERRREYYYTAYRDPSVRAKALERVRIWESLNPERVLLNRKVGKARRRSRTLNAAGSFSKKDIVSICKLQGGKCAYCKTWLGNAYHVDHIYPLSRGGTNDPRNLQLLCVRCNLAKAARDPIIHAQSLGFLL